jgi:hypothetical protein
MYAPQNLLDIATELASYIEVIQHLRSCLHIFLQGDALTEQLGKLNLSNHSAPLKDPRQWYNACFDQIQKAVDALKSDGLEQSGNP